MRGYLFFAVAGLASLMANLDLTIVVTAFAPMTQELNTDLSWVAWVMTGYMLTNTAVMPIMGKLSDDYGRKRVYLACVGMFTLGSLLCSLAPNVSWLIVFRGLQGLGGGGLMPSAMGIVSDQFPHQRERAIGLFSSIVPIGGVIGPNLGGLLLEHFSWRSIFYINLPVSVVVLTLGFLLLRNEPARPRHRLDLAGIGLLSGGILSLMYALTLMAGDSSGLHVPEAWGMAVLSAALLVLFVRQERRAEEPVVPLDLLRAGPFITTNLLNFLLGAMVLGVFSLIPLYAVEAYGFSIFESGALLTPRSIGMAVAAAASSFLLSRLRYRIPIILGMVINAVGLFLLGLGLTGVVVAGQPIGDVVLFGAFVGVMGIGSGLTAPALNNAVISLMPHRVAAISGLRGMFRVMGGVVGTSLMVFVLSLHPDQAAGMHQIFMWVAVITVPLAALALTIPNDGDTPLFEDTVAEAAPPRPAEAAARAGSRALPALPGPQFAAPTRRPGE